MPVILITCQKLLRNRRTDSTNISHRQLRTTFVILRNCLTLALTIHNASSYISFFVYLKKYRKSIYTKAVLRIWLHLLL